MELVHYKNVRVILTLSGLAQLHLFRGFYAVKHCIMWATRETSEQMQPSQPRGNVGVISIYPEALHYVGYYIDTSDTSETDATQTGLK